MNNKYGKSNLILLEKIYKDNLDYAYKKLEEFYPIQYLIGYVEFLNTKIYVDERVLIPRFETELLVDKTIKYLKTKNYQNLIDICTGSGVIAMALKKEFNNLNIDACDISNDALTLAKNNAKINKTDINFFKKNILIETLTKKYDCIISNPPYVSKDEKTSPETKYEPSIALFANNNGLEFYERILKLAPSILNKNASIIFEIGKNQGNLVKNLALKYYPNSKITIEKDYNNFDRFIFIETD